MKPAFTLPSPQTGTNYVIYVAGSTGRKPSKPSTAVVFMDGDNQFSAAVKAYQKLRAARKAPALLLVGVGYGASYQKPENKRGRDYTPTRHHYEPTSGGADAFLKFLRRTLWPELRRRYRLRKEARGIAGHSLGSLIVLYAMLRTPRFFTHFLASAPSIWWDDRRLLRIAERRRRRSAVLPARLFLSAGAKDSESMLVDLALLEQQLAAKPFRGLEVTSRRFPRRDHYNVLPVAFRDGLSTLFGASAPRAR